MNRVYYSRRKDTWEGKDILDKLHVQDMGVEYDRTKRRYRLTQLEDYETLRTMTNWMNHIELNRTIKLFVGSDDE